MTGETIAQQNAYEQSRYEANEALRQQAIAGLSPEAKALLGMDPQQAGMDRIEAAARAASFQAYYANQGQQISSSDAFSMASQAKASEAANQQRQAYLATPQAAVTRAEYSTGVTRGVNYGVEQPSFNEQLARNLANPAYENLTFTQVGRARELGVSPAGLRGEAWKTPSREAGVQSVIPLGSGEAYGGSGGASASPWQASFDKSALTLTVNPSTQTETAENAAIQRFQRGDYWGAANASLKFGTGGLYYAFQAARSGSAPQATPSVTVTPVPEVSSPVLTPEQARELVTRSFRLMVKPLFTGTSATLQGKAIGGYEPYPQPGGGEGTVTLGEPYYERTTPKYQVIGNPALQDAIAAGRNVVEPAFAGGASIVKDTEGYPIVVMPEGYRNPYEGSVDLGAARRYQDEQVAKYESNVAKLEFGYSAANQQVESSNARWGAFESRWAPLIKDGVFTGTPEQYAAYTKTFESLKASTPDTGTLYAPLEAQQAALGAQFKNLSLGTASLNATALTDYRARVGAEASASKQAAYDERVANWSPYSGKFLTAEGKAREQYMLSNPLTSQLIPYDEMTAQNKGFLQGAKESATGIIVGIPESVVVGTAGTFKIAATSASNPYSKDELATVLFTPNPSERLETLAKHQAEEGQAARYWRETYTPQQANALTLVGMAAAPALIPTNLGAAGSLRLLQLSKAVPVPRVTLPAVAGAAFGGITEGAREVMGGEQINPERIAGAATGGALAFGTIGAASSLRYASIKTPEGSYRGLYQVATEEPTGLIGLINEKGAGRSFATGTPALPETMLAGYESQAATKYGRALIESSRGRTPFVEYGLGVENYPTRSTLPGSTPLTEGQVSMLESVGRGPLENKVAVGRSYTGLTPSETSLYSRTQAFGEAVQLETPSAQPRNLLKETTKDLSALAPEQRLYVEDVRGYLKEAQAVSYGSGTRGAAIRATGISTEGLPSRDWDYQQVASGFKSYLAERTAKLPPGMRPSIVQTEGSVQIAFKETGKLFDVHYLGDVGPQTLSEYGMGLQPAAERVTPAGDYYVPLQDPGKISSLATIKEGRIVLNEERLKDIIYLKPTAEALSVGKSPATQTKLIATYENLARVLPEVGVSESGEIYRLGGASTAVYRNVGYTIASPLAATLSSYIATPSGYTPSASSTKSVSSSAQSATASYSPAYRYSSPSAYESPSVYSAVSSYPSPYAQSLAASSPSTSRPSASSAPVSQFSSLSSLVASSPSEAASYSSPLYESPSASSPSSPSPYSPASPSPSPGYDPYKIISPAPPLPSSGALGAFKVKPIRFSRLPVARRVAREDALADLVSKTRAEAVFKRPARSPRREVAVAHSKASLGLRVPTYEETTGELGKALKAMRKKNRSWLK